MRKLIALVLSLFAGVALAQTKPPVLPVWASSAVPTNDILQPNNTFIAAGWPLSSTPPSRQYFNWFQNYTMNGIRYFSHRGIADCDNAETYGPADIVMGVDTYIYKSRTANNIGNCPSVITLPNTNWDVPAVPTAPLGDNSVRIANTAFVHNNYVPLGGAFSLLGGQIGSGQVPFGAVQQYQASLSIGWGQLTGVPSSQSPDPGTLVQRDSAGDVHTRYLFATSPIDNQQITAIATVSNDGIYYRKSSVAFTQAAMPVSGFPGQVTAGQVPSGAVTQFSPQLFNYNPFISKTGQGCTQIPGGVTIMWGTMAPNGGTITVAFPCGGFANAVFSVVSNSTGIPTQSNVIGWNNQTFTVHNTGGTGNYIAIGF